jgi:hypothetical protein
MVHYPTPRIVAIAPWQGVKWRQRQKLKTQFGIH